MYQYIYIESKCKKVTHFDKVLLYGQSHFEPCTFEKYMYPYLLSSRIMASSSRGNGEATAPTRSEAVLKPFYDICQRKYVRGELGTPSQADHNTMESVLTVGRSYAIGATMLTFVLLRKLPKFSINDKIQKLQAKGQDFPQNKGGFFSVLPRITSRRDGRSVFQEGLVAGMFMGTLDAMVACVIGGATWYYMTPQQQLCESAGKIPLAAGTSMLSDTFCSDFIEQYKRRDPHNWKMQDDKDEDFIQGILGFIQNCQRRGIYEDQLRAEQGLPKDAPVEIPPPGVPHNIVIENDGEDGGNFDDIQRSSNQTHFS
jgi:hypothetical protein